MNTVLNPERVLTALNPSLNQSGDFFVWLVTGIILVLFTIASLILVYHWFTYGNRAPLIAGAFILYSAGSGIFLLILIISVLSLILP